jgi:predicted Zn-dependent protease
MKSMYVLWCAIAAAGAAGLAGCSGQSARVDVAESAAAAGPVVTSTEDFRKLRFAEAWRGLKIEGGLVVVDRDAAADLPIGDVSEAIARGDALFAENTFSGAIGEYRLALLADETNVEAMYKLGEALLGKRNDEKALVALRTASMLAPERTDIRLQYAETINRNGDVDGWADELENVLALDAAHGEAHARLAVARYYQGNRDDAKRQIALAERFGGNVPPQLKAMLNN